ncbi:amidase [Agromyces sp. SYSU T00194]|uniref:amidase n=1 Tax=Agromyces chitinivorans TaxID=3158560 RepID=UPI00339796A0
MNLGGRYRQLDEPAYCDSTGLDLGRGVADGSLSPVQLAELALDVARRQEAFVNAYAGFRAEAAIAEATRLESEARSGFLRSALHGVPIASKDNMYIVGEPARKGSRTTTSQLATTASPMVDRLVEAGAVIIGRTTTPEFGWKGTGTSPLTGVTRNPWDPSRTSGGSSAGSGATVGAGAVPIATGSDAGGSVRIPAAFCGVVGLKPTLSAIPVWPGTVNESLSHAGVLSRSIRDAREVLRITRGPDDRDPQSAFCAPVPLPGGRAWRIGVVREPWGIAPDADVATRLAPVFDALPDAGIGVVEEVALDMPVPRAIFEALWVTGRGLGFADLVRARSEEMDPGLARLTGLAEQYALSEFLGALSARREFNASIFEMFSTYDVLVMPTMPLTPFDADAEVPPGGEVEAPLPWVTWTPYTYPFNISGQPAVSVPVDLAEDRLPVALQVVGPWAADELVLAVAERLERIVAPTIRRRTGAGAAR